jgi:Holliday junction resolvasome RuvABC endonuclease subunit
MKNDLRILALDIATHTGWCSKTAHGVWDLSIKRDESSGMRLIRFKHKLKEIFKLEEINLVAFERTSGQHKNALIVQAELHGVLKSLCEELNIDYRAFSASEIKKFATGKGNAKKGAMVEAAQTKLGLIGDDDNEADAMWIHAIMKDSLGI